VFRADQTCKKVIDFKQLDEVQVAALTDYHVVVFDQYTEQQLCIFNALPEKQTTLVMHPNFDLASLPVVVASNNQGLSIEDVAKSGLRGEISLEHEIKILGQVKDTIFTSVICLTLTGQLLLVRLIIN